MRTSTFSDLVVVLLGGGYGQPTVHCGTFQLVFRSLRLFGVPLLMAVTACCCSLGEGDRHCPIEGLADGFFLFLRVYAQLNIFWTFGWYQDEWDLLTWLLMTVLLITLFEIGHSLSF